VAKKTITRLLDDLSGGDADQTVRFAFDGFTYEIDLSDRNVEKFRAAIQPYIEAGSRLGRVNGSSGVRYHQTKLPASDRAENSRIREWAHANGYELADRGRIPQTVMDAYASDTPNPVKVAADRAKAEAAARKVTPTVRKTAAAPHQRRAARAGSVRFSGTTGR
jgi:hypothetical protein